MKKVSFDEKSKLRGKFKDSSNLNKGNVHYEGILNLLRMGLVDISTTNFVRHSTWQIIWYYVQILYKKKVQFQRKNPPLEKVNGKKQD